MPSKKPVVLMMGGFDEIGEGPTCESIVRAKCEHEFRLAGLAIMQACYHFLRCIITTACTSARDVHSPGTTMC